MSKRIEAKHKIDRRLGVNLWGRPKSPINDREYGPGQHGQRRKKPTDYGIQLMAKQRLKGYYGSIGERHHLDVGGGAHGAQLLLEVVDDPRLEIVVPVHVDHHCPGGNGRGGSLRRPSGLEGCIESGWRSRQGYRSADQAEHEQRAEVREDGGRSRRAAGDESVGLRGRRTGAQPGVAVIAHAASSSLTGVCAGAHLALYKDSADGGEPGA